MKEHGSIRVTSGPGLVNLASSDDQRVAVTVAGPKGPVTIVANDEAEARIFAELTRVYREMADALRRQRDELFVVCEDLVDLADSGVLHQPGGRADVTRESLAKKARAAIAKVTAAGQ